jgi:hypothetical protein
METTLRMTPETNLTNWADVGRILAWILPFLLAVLHFINKYFADRVKEREAKIEKEEKDRVTLIASVAKETAVETVKETLHQYLAPMESNILALRQEIKEVHIRIDHVLENKK